MQISEIRKRKELMEQYIKEAIDLFEKETGLNVDKVHIYRTPMYTGFNENPGSVYVGTEIKI